MATGSESDAFALEYPTLLRQSLEELRIKTAAHDGIWQIGQAAWSADLAEGSLLFTSPGFRVTCRVHVVGTYNTDDGTWFWGWDHPSVPPPLRDHALRVREYGERYGIARLVTRKIECTEEDAWELTALACKLGGAQGGYRGPAGATLVFMTFDGVNVGSAPAGS